MCSVIASAPTSATISPPQPGALASLPVTNQGVQLVNALSVFLSLITEFEENGATVQSSEDCRESSGTVNQPTAPCDLAITDCDNKDHKNGAKESLAALFAPTPMLAPTPMSLPQSPGLPVSAGVSSTSASPNPKAPNSSLMVDPELSAANAPHSLPTALWNRGASQWMPQPFATLRTPVTASVIPDDGAAQAPIAFEVQMTEKMASANGAVIPVTPMRTPAAAEDWSRAAGSQDSSIPAIPGVIQRPAIHGARILEPLVSVEELHRVTTPPARVRAAAMFAQGATGAATGQAQARSSDTATDPRSAANNISTEQPITESEEQGAAQQNLPRSQPELPPHPAASNRDTPSERNTDDDPQKRSNRPPAMPASADRDFSAVSGHPQPGAGAPTPAQSAQRGQAILSQRAESAAMAARNTEIPEINAGAHVPSTREISMRIASPESPSVDIRLVDRAGSVRVAVRTPDAELSHSLQGGLSELVQRLERQGFETESWTPVDGSASPLTQPAHTNSGGSTSDHGSRDPRDSSQQGYSGHQNNARNRPRWVAAFEDTLPSGEPE